MPQMKLVLLLQRRVVTGVIGRGIGGCAGGQGVIDDALFERTEKGKQCLCEIF
jgi:hypothetical protein